MFQPWPRVDAADQIAFLLPGASNHIEKLAYAIHWKWDDSVSGFRWHDLRDILFAPPSDVIRLFA